MDVQKLTESTDAYFKDVFTYLYKTHGNSMNGDSLPQLSMADADELRSLQKQYAESRLVEQFGNFQTPQEAYNSTLLKIGTKILGDSACQPIQGEPGVSNHMWKWGTLNDPQIYSQANIPISFGPYESTAIYANGGLPAEIVNKKSRAMTLNGATFKALDPKFWDGDKIELLEAAADKTGFNAKAADGITDGFLYGGSILYPVFEKETRQSFLSKQPWGKISRWVNVDRWNLTFVPSFIVTARDYLHPETVLVPMSNAVIDSARISFIRPKSLPYWASIYNMGWCPSDLAGWLRAYYAYEITQMSVPVMAQQMSLLLYRLPLDGLNATVGPEAVEKLMNVNEAKMAEWNSLNPKAVNMVGEVEVVNRTYSGFDQFVGATKSELAAQCGLPEPSLWHTPNKGFSDNTQESLLKQSETLKMNQQLIERSMDPCRDALVAHVWGADSDEFAHRDDIKLVFNKPVISTEKDLAEVGARFAAAVNSFVQAGVAPDVAMDLCKTFFPSVKITDDMIKRAKESYDKMMEQTSKAPGEGQTSNGKKIGASNSGPKTQAPSNRIF